MSNKIQEFFKEKFGTVRATKIDDKIYFVGKDIAEKLGYVNPTKAISTHCKGVSKMGIPSNGGVQQMSVILEGDVFRLIVKSKLTSAEEFEHWIMEEILPTIRNTGGYVEDEREEEFVSKYFPSFSEEVKLSMVQDLLKSNKELKTKAGKWDKFLGTDSTYTFTDVSKLISTMSNEEKSDIEISSSKLTEFLRDSGILCKTKTPDKIKDGKVKKGSYKNLPNKEYEEYFDVVSVKANGFNKVQTRVKSKGVEFIYETLKNSYNKAV